jgi:hypothetical protein
LCGHGLGQQSLATAWEERNKTVPFERVLNCKLGHGLGQQSIATAWEEGNKTVPFERVLICRLVCVAVHIEPPRQTVSTGSILILPLQRILNKGSALLTMPAVPNPGCFSAKQLQSYLFYKLSAFNSPGGPYSSSPERVAMPWENMLRCLRGSSICRPCCR